ncbi:MAG: HAD family phosphatase [Clostridia bacterium]|nr:Cof-type HAD-IIB family hydrolase [Lachnospiraceae bacterium]NCB99202.1 HAD family phosphatase [Clostridia bacterium]NCD03374.1 HAD family phosphatase [Clostridia bacterium]
MNYKMIALDLDGTLTNSKKEITAHTRDVLIDIQKKGFTVVLATGRPINGATALGKELELDVYGGYILAFNGGMIQDCRTGNVIYQKKIPQEYIPRLGAVSRELQIPIVTYRGDDILTEDTTDRYVRLEAGINKMPVRELNDFSEEVDFPVTKCLMVADGWYLEEIMPRMHREFGNILNIFRSEPYFLEITPLGVDKATGLEWLLEYTGIGQQELICVGDGYNDITMLKFAGLGVAMDNAQPDVKSVADVVTYTNDNDGVAYIVETYMKNR